MAFELDGFVTVRNAQLSACLPPGAVVSSF